VARLALHEVAIERPERVVCETFAQELEALAGAGLDQRPHQKLVHEHVVESPLGLGGVPQRVHVLVGGGPMHGGATLTQLLVHLAKVGGFFECKAAQRLDQHGMRRPEATHEPERVAGGLELAVRVIGQEPGEIALGGIDPAGVCRGEQAEHEKEAQGYRAGARGSSPQTLE
jgi:hypothetical protein